MATYKDIDRYGTKSSSSSGRAVGLGYRVGSIQGFMIIIIMKGDHIGQGRWWAGLWYWFWTLFRSLLKWIMRLITGMSEVQRITASMPVESGAIFIENCLRMSKNLQVRELVSDLDRAADMGMFSESDADAAVYRYRMIKKIDCEVSPEFSESFKRSVLIIWGYRQTLWEVEKLRTTRYDSNLLEHEDKLYQLWMALMPREPLEGRISKQWQEIGFQGDDPKTDFRGMGMLGLENLIYFTKKYPRATQRFFSFSCHPKYGYTFAIVSINLTAMAYKLFKDDCAKTNIFNLFPMPDISAFHCFYSYVFYEFDKIWVESKPENMMEFSNIQQKLDKSIRSELTNDVERIFKVLHSLEQL